MYRPILSDFENLIKSIRYEVQNAQRPPEQTTLDEVDFCNYLKISKRTAATYRQNALIQFSKIGGKIYYRLSDVLELLEKNKVPAASSKVKIKL